MGPKMVKTKETKTVSNSSKKIEETGPYKRRLNIKKDTNDNCLMLRYLYYGGIYSIADLANIMHLPEDKIKTIIATTSRRLPKESLDLLFEKIGTPKELLLLQAKAWQDDTHEDTKGLIPVWKNLLLDNGEHSDSYYWFRKCWLTKEFHDIRNIDIMKLQDNSLVAYGLNRDDIVLVSRMDHHLKFRNKSLYMIQFKNGQILPRVGMSSTTDDGDILWYLANPDDIADRIPFSPLPDGVKMIGRIVWRGGML